MVVHMTTEQTASRINVVGLTYLGRSKNGNDTFSVEVRNDTNAPANNFRIPMKLKSRMLALFKDEVLRTLRVKDAIAPGTNHEYKFYVMPCDRVYQIDIFPVANGHKMNTRKPVASLGKFWRKGWKVTQVPTPTS